MGCNNVTMLQLATTEVDGKLSRVFQSYLRAETTILMSCCSQYSLPVIHCNFDGVLSEGRQCVFLCLSDSVSAFFLFPFMCVYECLWFLNLWMERKVEGLCFIRR